MQQIFGNAVTAKHITQSFNALSQRTQIARYQSTGTTNAVATNDFTFDTANRLSGIAHKQGATNLNTYAYTYDPLSRIATIVSTLEGTDTYSYDQTSQLVGATHTSHANETYGFDANGNRNTSGFTTGTNNQTTAGLGFTFVYDDEGNRTSKTETSTGKIEEYTWDHRNRLTKVVFRNTSGGAIVKQVDYEYDPYNRLVRRTFDADGAGAGAATNQYWVYDEGINAVMQFDGSSASNLSHRYLWSDNVDELLADEQIAGNNTLWGLADHLGSLRDIADYSESTGVTTIANHRTINSFGKLVSETNAAVDMLFAFTGKQFDEATGLQHNLFRWLDPSLGQWLNEDPLSFAAGDENVRRYVGNGVIGIVDPLGLDGWIPFPKENDGRVVNPLTGEVIPPYPPTPRGFPLPSNFPIDWNDYSRDLHDNLRWRLYRQGVPSIDPTYHRFNIYRGGCMNLMAARYGSQQPSGGLLPLTPGVEGVHYFDDPTNWLGAADQMVWQGDRIRLFVLQTVDPPRPLPSLPREQASRVLPMQHHGEINPYVIDIGRYNFASLHWDFGDSRWYFEYVRDGHSDVYRQVSPGNLPTTQYPNVFLRDHQHHAGDGSTSIWAA